MRFIAYQDVREFSDRVLPLLTTHEVENNVPIGILARGLQGMDTSRWLMARVEDDAGGDEVVALMTPPHNLLIVSREEEVPEEALRVLAVELQQRGIELPGIFAERALALDFSRVYGSNYEVEIEERVYQLEKVAEISRVGRLREADTSDVFFLPYWMKEYLEECLDEHDPLDAKGVLEAIDKRSYYLLEVEGHPVSLVGSSRQMPHGRSIGPVYTPPYLRGHGYASSAVAQLSELLLSRGNAYCALFTDLSNPVSNSIYQKVGYRPLRDYAQIRFCKATMSV